MKKGSFSLMKKTNQRLVLRIIQKEGQVSRSGLVEKTGLVPATVSKIVRELLRLELIKEVSRGESRGGRKPILIELNPDGAYFIGLEWGIAEIKAILLNFKFKVIDFAKITMDNRTPANYIRHSVGLIKNYSRLVNQPEKIYGVGIGLHGLVQVEQGISLYAPHFNWENIRLKAKIEELIVQPVFLDNDVRVMALAENWHGQGRDFADFVFINTGLGIGAGIVLKHKLHYGNHGVAGEFGHMSIVNERIECSCGNCGCLEALISTERLLIKYNQGRRKKRTVDQLKSEWQGLIKAAAAGNCQAVKVLTEAAEHLGTGIANIFNLINPQAVIIGGDFLQAGPLLLPLIKQQTAKKVLRVLKDRVKVYSTAFGEQIGAIGSATLAMQDLLRLERQQSK